MLHENLKNRRKACGLSQAELAGKVNVVRQTISKWEKGLSVPDSAMLIRLAEELDTTVGTLLGQTVPEEKPAYKAIAARLEVLNEQFAKQNERQRKTKRTICLSAFVIACGFLLLYSAVFLFRELPLFASGSGNPVIGGADAPTLIFLHQNSPNPLAITLAAGVILLTGIGLWKTKR